MVAGKQIIFLSIQGIMNKRSMFVTLGNVPRAGVLKEQRACAKSATV